MLLPWRVVSQEPPLSIGAPARSPPPPPLLRLFRVQRRCLQRCKFPVYYGAGVRAETQNILHVCARSFEVAAHAQQRPRRSEPSLTTSVRVRAEVTAQAQ